jgi:hypothetical protein
MTMIDYPFTEADVQRAAEDWGCNCGPAALAFALQVPLDRVRGAIPGFEQKRYTSPTMMRAALDGLGVRFAPAPTGLAVARANMFDGRTALVRVQWEGPWTAPGAHPKWAYRQTHWVATWLAATRRNESDRTRMVFDCNGGIRPFGQWEREIVPAIVATIPRANGEWFPTHVWRITEARP